MMRCTRPLRFWHGLKQCKEDCKFWPNTSTKIESGSDAVLPRCELHAVPLLAPLGVNLACGLCHLPRGLLQDFKQDHSKREGDKAKLKLPELLLADTGRENLELSLAHFQESLSMGGV